MLCSTLLLGNNIGGGEFQAMVTLMPPKKRLRLEKGQQMLFSALSDKGKKGASDEVNIETGESTTSVPSLDPVSDPTPEITNQSPGPSNDPPPGPSKPSSNRKVQVKWKKKLWSWVTLKDGKMHFTLCTEKGKNNTFRYIYFVNLSFIEMSYEKV